MLSALFAVTVQVAAPLYVTERGAVHALETGAVPAHEAGRVVGSIDLVSNRKEGPGQFVPPQLRVLWNVVDAGGASQSGRSHGDWVGALAASEPLPLTAFDPTTGAATVALSIPCGAVEKGLHAPRLAGGSGHIEFVLGWADELALDGGGLPSKFQWQGSLAYKATWPDAWIEIDRSQMALDDTASARLLLHEPAQHDTVFALSADVGGLVALPATVTVPAGESSVLFPIDSAGHGGEVHVSAAGGGGTATSSVTVRVGAVTSMSAGEPLTPQWDYLFNRTCQPPSCEPLPAVTYRCSGCFNASSFACPDLGFFYRPYGCGFDLFDACVGGDSAWLTCPEYQKIDEFYDDCFLVGQRKCCIYRRLPEMTGGNVDSCH